MSESNKFNSSPYDQKFDNTPGLTWSPWVGSNYQKLPEDRKVLIVGESHYSSEEDPKKAKREIAGYLKDPNSTREMVEGTLVTWAWKKIPPTLSIIHDLLYAPEDSKRFWSDLCYYNFVQRPMRYYPQPAERPNQQDFTKGWEVFLKVVEILEPSHVLMIGVQSADHFNGFMHQHNQRHTPAVKVTKVGNTYPRTASVKIGKKSIPLHFIRHCGSYFSTDSWFEYLEQNAPKLMKSVASSAKMKS